MISISTASLVPSPYGVENMFMSTLIPVIDLVYKRKKNKQTKKQKNKKH